MKIHTTTRGLELTSEISSYAEKRLSQVDKLIGEADLPHASCDLFLVRETPRHQQGEIFSAEMILKMGKTTVFSKASESSILASIDVAKDELVRSLKHQKKRRFVLVRKGAAKVKEILKGLRF